MTKNEILDDLDYIKTLAIEGKNAPMLGGWIGLMWGVLLFVTLFIHWTAIKGFGALPLNMIGLAWMGMVIIGSVGSAVLGRQVSKKPGAASVNNRAAHALWTGIAILLIIYSISALASALKGNVGFIIMDTIIPIAFGLYALANFVLYKMSGDKWQLILAIIATAFVPIGLFLIGKPELYLAAMVGIVCTHIIPDIISIGNQPKDIV